MSAEPAETETLDEAVARVDLPRLSSAIRKLATAASANFGSDCYIHAAIAKAILEKLGVEALIVVGFAAFRVGDGDSDVITHSPTPGMVDQPGGVVYHVWLEIADNILDLSTYALREKAAQLDKLDGGHTTVTWCPDYVFAPKSSLSSMRDVIQLHAGLYHYSYEPDVADKIISAAPDLDEDDVNAAWLLYQNQEMAVFGPNNTR
jgi:hypothetical protein